MRKLWEFGRKAIFYIRVLSGYEERRIRSYRLQLHQHLKLVQQRKEAARKLPEQLILSEVRRMVDEMQNLNKRLEEMEADIDTYFKPIDKEVGVIIEMQMEKEKANTEMMASLYKHAMLEKAMAETAKEVNCSNNEKIETTHPMFKESLLGKDAAEIKNQYNQTKTPSTAQI